MRHPWSSLFRGRPLRYSARTQRRNVRYRGQYRTAIEIETNTLRLSRLYFLIFGLLRQTVSKNFPKLVFKGALWKMVADQLATFRISRSVGYRGTFNSLAPYAVAVMGGDCLIIKHHIIVTTRQKKMMSDNSWFVCLQANRCGILLMKKAIWWGHERWVDYRNKEIHFWNSANVLYMQGKLTYRSPRIHSQRIQQLFEVYI